MQKDHCLDHAAHDRAITVHDRRLNEHGHQIDDMALILQKLSDIEEQNAARILQAQERLDAQAERINALEQQPAADAKRIKDAALAAVGGAVGTSLVAVLSIAISKSLGI